MTLETVTRKDEGGASRSSQKLPPASPAYILRGHGSPVHALHFYASNSRLISGDSDGWVLIWDISLRRPVVSWRAHRGAVLEVKGVETCGERRVFTHGRDHKLRVWRVNLSDEGHLSKALPADRVDAPDSRQEPWLLHSLDVNALNFCKFSSCSLPIDSAEAIDGAQKNQRQPHFCIAVPNALNEGGIDVFHLPSQRRVSTIAPDLAVKTGMLMAVDVFINAANQLCIVSGYEEGTAMVHIQKGDLALRRLLQGQQMNWTWERVYSAKAHSQPILALSTPPDHTLNWFFTSSADAIIAKHSAVLSSSADDTGRQQADIEQFKVNNTRHAGQQGLTIRSDGKIFATAGWDGRARVYSCKTLRELAVLKWHTEGCYSLAFAAIGVDADASTAPGVPVGETQVDEPADSSNTTMALQTRAPLGLAAIRQKRSMKAQLTHWLAVGGKDGKVSLWDIY